MCVSMHSWSDNYNRLQPQMDYIQSDEYELVSLCRLNNFELNQALSSALKHQKVFALSLSRFANSISVWCAQLCCTERFIRYNMAMCHGKGGIFCCCCSYFMFVYIPCVSSKSIWMKTPACPRKHAQQLLKMWDNIMKYPKIRTLHEKKTDGEMMRSEGGKIALIFISHTQQIKNTIVIHSLSLIRSLP